MELVGTVNSSKTLFHAFMIIGYMVLATFFIDHLMLEEQCSQYYVNIIYFPEHFMVPKYSPGQLKKIPTSIQILIRPPGQPTY